MHREAEQAAVPVVVDLLAQVGDQLRRGILEAAITQDPSRLFGDENLAGRREADRRRRLEAGQHDLVLEGRQRSERGRRRRVE